MPYTLPLAPLEDLDRHAHKVWLDALEVPRLLLSSGESLEPDRRVHTERADLASFLAWMGPRNSLADATTRLHRAIDAIPLRGDVIDAIENGDWEDMGQGALSRESRWMGAWTTHREQALVVVRPADEDSRAVWMVHLDRHLHRGGAGILPQGWKAVHGKQPLMTAQSLFLAESLEATQRRALLGFAHPDLRNAVRGGLPHFRNFDLDLFRARLEQDRLDTDLPASSGEEPVRHRL